MLHFPAMILLPILGNSGKSDEADVIEIERPQDFVVIDLCDNRDKHKNLATSNSPSDDDNEEEEEECANLIQDARQKGRRMDTPRPPLSDTAKPSVAEST